MCKIAVFKKPDPEEVKALNEQNIESLKEAKVKIEQMIQEAKDEQNRND